MDDWTTYILLIEGLPLLGFIYYFEHKKRMYILERYGQKIEPAGSVREKKLVRGVFLSLAGSAMIYVPKMSSILGLKADMTFEMFLIGVLTICAGLAILLSSGMLRPKAFTLSDEESDQRT